MAAKKGGKKLKKAKSMKKVKPLMARPIP